MKETVLISMPVEDLEKVIIDCVNACLQHHKQPSNIPTPSTKKVTAEYLCNTLGYMALNTFYQRAPKGGVPGAFKIGARWFVDVEEFESKSKEAMMV